MVPVLRVPGDPLLQHPRQPLSWRRSSPAGYRSRARESPGECARPSSLPHTRASPASARLRSVRRARPAAHDPGGSPKNSTSIPLPVRSRSDSRPTRPPADPPAGHAAPGDGSRSKPTAKAHPAGRPRSHRLTRMRRFLSRVGLGRRVVSGHRGVSRRPDRGGEAMSAGPQEFPPRHHAQDHGPAPPPQPRTALQGGTRRGVSALGGA
jgi:hypothetical protein